MASTDVFGSMIAVGSVSELANILANMTPEQLQNVQLDPALYDALSQTIDPTLSIPLEANELTETQTIDQLLSPSNQDVHIQHQTPTVIEPILTSSVQLMPCQSIEPILTSSVQLMPSSENVQLMTSSESHVNIVTSSIIIQQPLISNMPIQTTTSSHAILSNQTTFQGILPGQSSSLILTPTVMSHVQPTAMVQSLTDTHIVRTPISTTFNEQAVLMPTTLVSTVHPTASLPTVVSNILPSVLHQDVALHQNGIASTILNQGIATLSNPIQNLVWNGIVDNVLTTTKLPVQQVLNPDNPSNQHLITTNNLSAQHVLTTGGVPAQNILTTNDIPTQQVLMANSMPSQHVLTTSNVIEHQNWNPSNISNQRISTTIPAQQVLVSATVGSKQQIIPQQPVMFANNPITNQSVLLANTIGNQQIVVNPTQVVTSVQPQLKEVGETTNLILQKGTKIALSTKQLQGLVKDKSGQYVLKVNTSGSTIKSQIKGNVSRTVVNSNKLCTKKVITTSNRSKVSVKPKTIATISKSEGQFVQMKPTSIEQVQPGVFKFQLVSDNVSPKKNIIKTTSSKSPNLKPWVSSLNTTGTIIPSSKVLTLDTKKHKFHNYIIPSSVMLPSVSQHVATTNDINLCKNVKTSITPANIIKYQVNKPSSSFSASTASASKLYEVAKKINSQLSKEKMVPKTVETIKPIVANMMYPKIVKSSNKSARDSRPSKSSVSAPTAKLICPVSIVSSNSLKKDVATNSLKGTVKIISSASNSSLNSEKKQTMMDSSKDTSEVTKPKGSSTSLASVSHTSSVKVDKDNTKKELSLDNIGSSQELDRDLECKERSFVSPTENETKSPTCEKVGFRRSFKKPVIVVQKLKTKQSKVVCSKQTEILNIREAIQSSKVGDGEQAMRQLAKIEIENQLKRFKVSAAKIEKSLANTEEKESEKNNVSVFKKKKTFVQYGKQDNSSDSTNQKLKSTNNDSSDDVHSESRKRERPKKFDDFVLASKSKKEKKTVTNEKPEKKTKKFFFPKETIKDKTKKEEIEKETENEVNLGEEVTVKECEENVTVDDTDVKMEEEEDNEAIGKTLSEVSEKQTINAKCNTQQMESKKKTLKKRKRKKPIAFEPEVLPEHLKTKPKYKQTENPLIELSKVKLKSPFAETSFLLNDTIEYQTYKLLIRNGWVCTFCGKPGNLGSLDALFGPYKVKVLRKNVKSMMSVWIHRDCAIWTSNICLSDEMLYGLGDALDAASKTKCSLCSQVGATLVCGSKQCRDGYHFVCAKQRGCTFMIESFTITCPKHKK